MCDRNEVEPSARVPTGNWGRGEGINTMALQRHIEKSVSHAFRVPETELRARTRRRAQTAFARQVAMYLAHVGCGLSYSEVGRLFGRDRTTAAHACKLIEDRRDDPDLDLSLDHLEQAVRRWASRRNVSGLPGCLSH
ncbi:MAG: chromosomal replication initiator DnaA [Hyphomicrobiales bacterium]|nr:MAG: chromosomal replication initiator DnaA [Hyphomicrobiales bacterium]